MKFLALLFFCLLLYGQTPEETAEKVYLANINTLLIFTSESGLNSGAYKFTQAGFKMQTNSLPFKHNFEPFKENMNLFINGGVGYSITRLETQTRDTKSANNIDLRHDNKLQTYTAGLGLGLRYISDHGIDYLGYIGIIYSRVGTSVSPNDEIGEAIEDFFDGEYNDNITYKFLLAAEYNIEFEGYKPYIKIDVKSYETKADFSLDALSGFSTQSRVASLSLGTETPSLLKYEEDFLSLEGYVKVNFLEGDITDVVQFRKYMNLGGIVYWNTPQAPSWAKRFYTEVSTVRAEGLEGYNIGIGFSIDY
ncbi:MAG: hypothetical protein COA44_12230 [Arcobacter sp.]|nr:MAG: hypothetical protein COA44_12230 [Arcobacter sp.]